MLKMEAIAALSWFNFQRRQQRIVRHTKLAIKTSARLARSAFDVQEQRLRRNWQRRKLKTKTKQRDCLTKTETATAMQIHLQPLSNPLPSTLVSVSSALTLAMKDVEQSPSDVDQMKLEFFLDNVKDDRTELDLLFGCMLNWGVQLSLPMSTETVDGCNIYTVNEGDLVACLTKDQPVTENIVRAIAEKSPLRVLFRDGSFASDAAKINIFEQFKQLMDWSDDEIIKNVRVL